jgi:hypothetical protein
MADSFELCARAEPVVPRRAATRLAAALPRKRRRVCAGVVRVEDMVISFLAVS